MHEQIDIYKYTVTIQKALMQPSSRKWQLKTINYDDWMSFSAHIQYGNLLQSWAYGESKRAEGWIPKRYLLVDGSGNKHGLVQVLVKRLYRTAQVARINRGPILFRSDHIVECTPYDVTQIWKAINQHALEGLVVNLMPEATLEKLDITHSRSRQVLEEECPYTVDQH